ncbi:MAG: hypothetical protein JWM19_7139 [Actinomycetia bacterium]|nr:hypothetical protein [Actinomycetes bacterium]
MGARPGHARPRWALKPTDSTGKSFALRPPAGLRLAEERRCHVRAVADAMMQAQEAELAGQDFDEAVVSGLSERDAMADPSGILARLMDVPGQAALALSLMEGASGLSGDELFYLRACVRARSSSARTPMLLQAVFLTSIGIAEPLVTRMVLLLLHHGSSPGAYESLADPRLEERARELCFGAPGKWRKALVEILGVATWPGRWTGSGWPCCGRTGT